MWHRNLRSQCASIFFWPNFVRSYFHLQPTSKCGNSLLSSSNIMQDPISRKYDRTSTIICHLSHTIMTISNFLRVNFSWWNRKIKVEDSIEKFKRGLKKRFNLVFDLNFLIPVSIQRWSLFRKMQILLGQRERSKQGCCL